MEKIGTKTDKKDQIKTWANLLGLRRPAQICSRHRPLKRIKREAMDDVIGGPLSHLTFDEGRSGDQLRKLHVSA